MTSIIIAALGVAVGLAAIAVSLCILWRRAERARTAAVALGDGWENLYRLWMDRAVGRSAGLKYAGDQIATLRAEIARLSPLAEIGERRLIADRKYKAKHRKGASASQTGLSSLRDEAGKPSSPEASIPSAGGGL